MRISGAGIFVPQCAETKTPVAFGGADGVHSTERNERVTSVARLLVAFELSKNDWRARRGSAFPRTSADRTAEHCLQVETNAAKSL